MTRYREANAAAKPPVEDVGADQAAILAAIAAAGKKKKTINYIWMPDKDGNLVKKDSAFVKKSFSSLSESVQSLLAQYLISQNRQPTDAARRTLFNSIVSAAETAYKEGKKQSPFDILQIQIDNAPPVGGPTISYTSYDKITSDAVLRNAAKQLGFTEGSFAQFGEQDLADFYNKLVEAAKSGAKVRQTIVNPDGTTEIVETPGGFDANAFAQNYLWAKVNIGDPKTIPTSVLKKVDALRSVLKMNGLDYLGQKEIANYALQLSKGETTLDDLKKQFNAKAAELYPLFADRLKANPNLTVMDLAEPYIGRMVKYWEVDPTTIDLSNPDLDKFLRPDGTAGKVAMGSLADFETYLKFHPNAEKSSWAISGARDLATGLASAMGFGV
jgi:hypothetical protein